MVVSRSGRLLPKLLDFGIARTLDPAQAALDDSQPLAHVRAGAQVAITGLGAVLGSPPYMAPELWVDARDAGPASDQYALGVLAYEAITGRAAFSGHSRQKIADAHAQGTLRPLGAEFPAGLERVIRRALAREPASRFANVLELAHAFREGSGLGSLVAAEIPRLDEELRQRFLMSAPQPIAEAIGRYESARNAHQAREALRGLIRIAAWYTGILALACRTRVGSGSLSDSEEALSTLRELRTKGLEPSGWITLARALTRPFATRPDTFPIPELVLLLHSSEDDRDPFASCLRTFEQNSPTDSSDESAMQAAARELPAVTSLLRSLNFLTDYPLVVVREGYAESWMGTRGDTRPTLQLRRQLSPGCAVVVDREGTPVVDLRPLVVAASPVPGHAERLFLIAGSGRETARLLSWPEAFEHHDPAVWDWFREHLLPVDKEAGSAPVVETPYRGLSSFTAADAGWFYGREREVQLVVNRLRIDTLVAIAGPSGVGKSSFAHAGVATAMQGWRALNLRPGRAPMSALGEALERAERRQSTEAATRGLLIIVDQFEELFTLGCPSEERDRFVSLLLEVARRPGDDVRVLITLRDDFLIRAQQLPGMGEALARGLHLLGPLSKPALEKILVEPARRAGYEFEDPELPGRMAAAVSGTPAAVALVSFTAMRLWELRDRHFHQLPRKAYDAHRGCGRGARTPCRRHVERPAGHRSRSGPQGIPASGDHRGYEGRARTR